MKAKPPKSKTDREKKPGADAAETPARPQGALSVVREWADALVIAFLLAMFIRTFVVELFKIPSGSMTPTLVGTSVGGDGSANEYVLEWDVNEDGVKDLVLKRLDHRRPRYHVFYRNENGQFTHNEETDTLYEPVHARRNARVRNDRIVVNKFIYWFRPPQRGEIVVFRVPPSIYEREKPIYIKRVVGLPGERVEIDEPHLLVNGERVTEPDVFQRIEYVKWFGPAGNAEDRPPYIDVHTESLARRGGQWAFFDGATVPEDHYLVFGDNSKSSKDSRDWGAVPEENLKGMAILRYWPWDVFGFLD